MLTMPMLCLLPVRVLVVDDYAPFRRFIGSKLARTPEWRIVGEVSDGLEAVDKAEELQPDLILLDLGLPNLNGMEAARRIRKVAPMSKIVFISIEFSADVIQAVLKLGAMGYVIKTHAATELLPAIEAACQGRQYVSNGNGSPKGLKQPTLSDHAPLSETAPLLK